MTMSKPDNVFQQTGKHIKTGNLTFLTTQVAQWQRLTKIIQPLLPQPEQWQVVCYQNGSLIITGENQAMISQLSYLQSQYISIKHLTTLFILLFLSSTFNRFMNLLLFLNRS